MRRIIKDVDLLEMHQKDDGTSEHVLVSTEYETIPFPPSCKFTFVRDEMTLKHYVIIED